MVIYEIHVGTFTPKGTFEAVIPRIKELGELGVNALEIMPVAQFPGERNWGYDGAYPFAVQNSYGGPEELKHLVNECHKTGIAVILDVVYNHLGPEGNYLYDFAPYFTEKYKTPWGKAINFDGAYSDEVRNFFIENALYWFKNYHMDALRIDAIHGIYDMSAKPFLQELGERVEEFSIRAKRKFYLIAESDLNDSRAIRPRGMGGYGLDAQWCDDFHHSLHTLLTNEKSGYYIDFGAVKDLETSFREGFVYSDKYSRFRKRHHGNVSKDLPGYQFVVFSQNHDQVGNRMSGERLSILVNFEGLKLAAATVLVSPYIPLLFMGEEYGEDCPFLYFISHSDPELVKAVREGRKREFKAFNWDEALPDPQSVETFLTCKLIWEKRVKGNHKVLLDFYQRFITLRKTIPALAHLDKNSLEVSGIEEKRILFLSRWHKESRVSCILGFSKEEVSSFVNFPAGQWKKRIDSSEEKWGGPGSLMPTFMGAQKTDVVIKPFSFVLYEKQV